MLKPSPDPRRYDECFHAPQRDRLPGFIQLYPRAVDGPRTAQDPGEVSGRIHQRFSTMHWNEVRLPWLSLSNMHDADSRITSLARAEMLLAMSKVFREVNFTLFETTRKDVTLAHELFLPFPEAGSKGVRVLVTN